MPSSAYKADLWNNDRLVSPRKWQTFGFYLLQAVDDVLVVVRVILIAWLYASRHLMNFLLAKLRRWCVDVVVMAVAGLRFACRLPAVAFISHISHVLFLSHVIHLSYLSHAISLSCYLSLISLTCYLSLMLFISHNLSRVIYLSYLSHVI